MAVVVGVYIVSHMGGSLSPFTFTKLGKIVIDDSFILFYFFGFPQATTHNWIKYSDHTYRA